ncbi:MAG: hypothetical protein AAFP76_04220 [Bacteroidota bacterium]
MRKKFWTSDKIVSFVAMGVSLFTLFIFIKQTNLIEDQSKRSVMPYLLMETSEDNQNKQYRIEIVNHGVGPAIIESRKILYKGEVYDMEFAEFIESKVPGGDSLHIFNRSTLQKGFALPAGAARTMIQVGGDSYARFKTIMGAIMEEGFNYEITYKSLYDQQWVITGQSEAPNAIGE